MKSTVTETPCKQEIKYPCLMKHTNSKIIVLFEKKRTGVLMEDRDKYTGLSVGHYSDNWSHENEYELFTGSVCLENDND